MTVQMLKGKIHRATVKQAELNYVGSITVDADLLDATGIYEYEKVAIVDIENGNRFEKRNGKGFFFRRGAQCAPISLPLRSSRLSCCYIYGLLSAGATQQCRCDRRHLRIFSCACVSPYLSSL